MKQCVVLSGAPLNLAGTFGLASNSDVPTLTTVVTQMGLPQNLLSLESTLGLRAPVPESMRVITSLNEMLMTLGTLYRNGFMGTT